jgi:23S rRNA pseudouridine1911/1915/1917 synthase
MGQNKRYFWLDGRSEIIQPYVKGGGILSSPLFLIWRTFMRELVFPVPHEYDGIRLKSFLRGYCGLSTRLMIKLKRVPLGITNNGLHATVIDILKAGDMVRILMPDDEKQLEPVNLPLSVLYEDCDVLIVDKPADMTMYPAPGHDSNSLANAVAAHFLNSGQKLAFRPVYRLDKDTTGLVVLAKNAYVAACLAGAIEKLYIAVCEGMLTGSGMINEPIGLKEGHRIQRAVTPHGERAVTKWRSICCEKEHSFVVIKLETGRTHQIRVHLSHLGHPLAGDDMYGGSLDFIARQALHCGRVRFIHPVTKQKMQFTCDLPGDIQNLLNVCDLKN